MDFIAKPAVQAGYPFIIPKARLSTASVRRDCILRSIAALRSIVALGERSLAAQDQDLDSEGVLRGLRLAV